MVAFLMYYIRVQYKNMSSKMRGKEEKKWVSKRN
jgi:hypothetical protein